MYGYNPTSKTRIRDIIYSAISRQYTVSKQTFDEVWETLEQQGVIDDFLRRKAERAAPAPAIPEPSVKHEELKFKPIDKLSSDENLKAMDMLEKKSFDRSTVNDLYEGLSAEVKGTSRGLVDIRFKRADNLQQFFTNPDVAKLMVDMLRIPNDASVYDPSCGSGRLLYPLKNYVLAHGVELETNAYDIAKRMYPQAMIVQDDMVNHVYDDVFDYILSNPPFSISLYDNRKQLKHCRGSGISVLSHFAALEIVVRAVKPGGYIAIILPGKTFPRLDEAVKFKDWLQLVMDVIAVVELPEGVWAHSKWKSNLYILQRSENRTNRWVSSDDIFKYTLENMSDIPALLETWVQHADFESVRYYSETRKTKKQFQLVKYKPPSREEKLIGKAFEVTSQDIVTMDIAKEITIDKFTKDPLKLIPNGVVAGLKIHNVKERYWPPKFSELRQQYRDIFTTQALRFDSIVAGVDSLFSLPLSQRLLEYNCQIEMTPALRKGIEEKALWFEFQNTPFEQWIDPELDSQWQHVNIENGLSMKYPDEYNAMKAKLEAFGRDDRFITTNPRDNTQYNWMDKLFAFQKEDAIRIALKNSVVYANMMGLGKTRSTIATHFLKDSQRTLIICPSKLIDNWIEEITEELNLSEPLVLKYIDDIDRIPDYEFCIVGYTRNAMLPIRRGQKARKRKPKGKAVTVIAEVALKKSYEALKVYADEKGWKIDKHSWGDTYYVRDSKNDTVIEVEFNIEEKKRYDIIVDFDYNYEEQSEVIISEFHKHLIARLPAKTPLKMEAAWKPKYRITIPKKYRPDMLEIAQAELKDNPDEPELELSIEGEGLLAEIGEAPEDIPENYQEINPRKVKDQENQDEEEELKRRMLFGEEHFSDHYKNLFDMCIVDEVHYCSNPVSHRSVAVAKMNVTSWLLLTGTPIKNRVRGLFNILDIGWKSGSSAFPFNNHQFYQTFTMKKTKSDIKKYYRERGLKIPELPVSEVYIESMGYKRKKEGKIELPTIQNPHILISLMESKWLRRTKYEPDVQVDVPFIPPKIIEEYIPLSKEQKAHYDVWHKSFEAIYESYIADESHGKSSLSKKTLILALIGKLKMAALMPQYAGVNASGIMKMRKALDQADFDIDYDKAFEYDYHGGVTPRQQKIVDLTKDYVAQGKSVLIIAEMVAEGVRISTETTDNTDDSSSDETITLIDFIAELLEKEGINSLQITGKVLIGRKRTNIVKRFMAGEAKVLIATIGTLDVGLNLPDVDVAIIMQPNWNYSAMEQAWSRMLRPRSKGEKPVHILMQDFTLDSYLWILASMKKYNVNKVLDRISVGEEPIWLNWEAAMAQSVLDRRKNIGRAVMPEEDAELE